MIVRLRKRSNPARTWFISGLRCTGRLFRCRWVLASEVGFLWTPGYWGWGGSAFEFYEGYWGPRIGFYGGINYGYGYFGRGYEGGRWDGGHFYYNRTVNNTNVTEIHNTYNTTVVNNNVNVTRVSYNGGNGGVNARETAEEQAAARERHFRPVAAQTQHIQAARSNRELRASENKFDGTRGHSMKYIAPGASRRMRRTN
jgi:hypothetical protein